MLLRVLGWVCVVGFFLWVCFGFFLHCSFFSFCFFNKTPYYLSKKKLIMLGVLQKTLGISI